MTARPLRQRGFTLIELLIALALMAVLSGLAWRGIDTLMRTREQTQAQVNRIASVQTTLAQWRSDLDALQPVPGLSASGLDWNGQVLRLLRRSPWPSADGRDSGLIVTAWTLREGQWLRWQSPPLIQRDALQRAWQQAEQWARDPSADDLLRQTRLFPVSAWQIVYFRGNAWVNPLSSSGSDARIPGISPDLPDGIRLQLDVLPDSGLSGRLTLDWVRPNFSNSKT